MEPFRPFIAFVHMLRLTAAILTSAFVVSTPAFAQRVEDSKTDEIGPWEIEATFKSDKFDHCAISRTFDDVAARFVRTSDGLSLVLESPNWKLERGKHYAVLMKAGSARWDTEVAAESNSVSVPISDRRFSEALRLANTLSVEGAGATVPIPLDKSSLALARLDACFDKNSRAVETNPFVAPKRQP
jgi:hypothetical protein